MTRGHRSASVALRLHARMRGEHLPPAHIRQVPAWTTHDPAQLLPIQFEVRFRKFLKQTTREHAPVVIRLRKFLKRTSSASM